MQRLLAVFPHPDDETFIAGGTLAIAAAAGIEVRVVSLTSGENGWDRSGIHTSPETLGGARRMEFEDACTELGVLNRECLGFPDGTLGDNEEQVVAAVANELRAFKPDTVLTFGCDGAYGHVDHIASWAAATLAIEMWESTPLHISATTDGPAVEKLWRALSKLRVSTNAIVATDYPSRRAKFRAQHYYPLEIQKVASTKLAALSAHQTQLVKGDPLSFLKPEVTERLLREEVLTFETGTPAAFGKLMRLLTASAISSEVS